jgi:hypothetical protein
MIPNPQHSHRVVPAVEDYDKFEEIEESDVTIWLQFNM